MKGISGFRFLLPAALAGLACTDPTSVTTPHIQPSAAVAVLPPGAIPVNACGTVISQPGDYWLTKDLRNCAQTYSTISISADNVTLHLNGHRLEADPRLEMEECISVAGSNVAILGPGTLGFCWKGIVMSGTGTRVRGVKLASFDLGIYQTGGGNNLIEDVTFLGGGYAAITGASSSTIRHSTFAAELENHIDGGTNLVIESNTLFGGGPNGAINVSDGNTISNNRIRDAVVGISGGSGNTISGNHLNGRDIGIMISGSGNVISGNGVENFGYLDLWDLNPDGCMVNTWINNRFSTADPICLQ
jgi:hypothetical protein